MHTHKTDAPNEIFIFVICPDNERRFHVDALEEHKGSNGLMVLLQPRIQSKCSDALCAYVYVVRLDGILFTFLSTQS